MYTDDKNAQVVLSLLKQYGIKKIVISPGTTNVPISRSVQLDPWFEVYSIVDERSAAYFATGLAYSSGEPVVISCTGATASRNYLPGMTEAFYRNLPVIALTSQHHVSDYDSLAPQVTDRTVSQNDVKKLSVNLPVVKDDEDYERCVISTNKALIAATASGGGPVHINLQVVGDYSFTSSAIPLVRKIEYYTSQTIGNSAPLLVEALEGKRIGVFIGAHRKFSEEEARSLENFAVRSGATVFIDHTSSYKGKNAMLISQIADLKRSQNKPDLIIDMGSITGDYTVNWLYGIPAWRLSEDGKLRDRLNNQTLLFDGPESVFFDTLTPMLEKKSTEYYKELVAELGSLIVPEDMPLSNTYVSYKLAQSIPKNTNLHLGILNSLRNMNFFSLDRSVDTSSNVGGFGIDGALSTAIGQSMADKTKLTFCLIGDLASFYDMNALGIRHIEKNIRILMVNNNGGVEFRLNPSLETQWSNETDEFISAGGHYGSIKGWAESMNFHYMQATTKKELDQLIGQFSSGDINAFDKPVLFEVFTSVPDEQKSVSAIQDANRLDFTTPATDSSEKVSDGDIKRFARRIAPNGVKNAYRKLRGRN